MAARTWPGTAGSSGYGGWEVRARSGTMWSWPAVGGRGPGWRLRPGRRRTWPAAAMDSAGRLVEVGGERESGDFFVFIFLDFLVDLIGGS
jgi:hypothetical protein